MLPEKNVRPYPSTAISFITMKRRIIIYVQWGSQWRKYQRELKLQNPVTGKPTASTEQRIAQAVQSEASVSKGKTNRVVERNHSLEHYKQQAREKLLSEIGEIKRKKRTADVEPVFAHVKHNRNFKRFTHRGLDKVELEFGLHALAHNIRKKSA